MHRLRDKLVAELAAQTPKLSAGGESADGKDSETPILTELQTRIYEELARGPMTAEDMTTRLQEIGVEKGLTTVKRALAVLKNLERVKNKRGLGYYRADMPPKPAESHAT